MNTRIFALLILFTGFAIYAKTQVCPPGEVSFQSQQEIDSFAVNYPGCSVIEGNVGIFADDITNLNGLAGISVIKGWLFIGGSMLSDLSGLNNLDSIHGGLRIEDCDALTSLDDFNDLVYIGGNLEIYWNYNLSSITGFPNLAFHSGNDIGIYENSVLQSCSSPGLCSFIANPTCPVTIYDNAPGFNSPGELAQSCNVPLVCLPYGNLVFHSQAEIDSFPYLYPGCSTLNGFTRISGPVTSLLALNQVNRINGDLVIQSATLNNLEGLNNVDSISGRLGLLNMGLTSLSGLNGLKYIGWKLEMNSLSHLTDISALSNLNHAGAIEMILLQELPTLYGLHNLDNHTGWIGLINNFALADISALSSIDSIDYHLELHGLNQLTDFQPLSNLKYVGWGLNLYNNTALTSLKGLDNIDGGSMQSVTIRWNPLLTECEVASICNYIADTSAYTYIYFNGPGCDSVEQVRAICETVNTNNTAPQQSITIFPNPSEGIFTISGSITSGEVLTLYDYSGRKVKTISFNKPLQAVDISNLSNGLYFLKTNTTTLKILKTNH